MRLHASNTSKDSLKDFQESLPSLFQGSQRVIGREMASRITDEVRTRIPSRGGWYSIYKNSIQFRELEDGSEWAVAGLAEIKISDPPADTTLVAFAGTDVAGQIMKAYNPWVIDLIPPIKGGYKDLVVVRSSPDSEVNTARDRLSPLVPSVVSALENAGLSVMTDSSLPVMNGKVYADIAFLARRLELGFPGYPRVPHWGPATSKAAANAESWVGAPNVVKAVDAALTGTKIPAVNVMSAAEAKALAKLREATWS